MVVSSRAGAQTVSAKLPEVHLKNLGGDQGATPAEAARLILAAIYKNVGSPAVTEALRKSTEALDEALDAARDDARKSVESAREDARKELEDAADKARKLLGR